MLRWCWLGLPLLVVACPQPPAVDPPAVDAAVPDSGPSCEICIAGYAQPTTSGAIALAAVSELSGLAASRRHPDVYYGHNDSGDSARLFAVDEQGSPRSVLLLEGARAVDWEDIAVGPCADGWCIFVGDIGDNGFVRTQYSVFVVPEPETLDEAGSQSVPWQNFRFRYPDGAHNSEALLVHPQSGALYVVTKTTRTATVYQLPQPLDADSVATLNRVATLPLPNQADAMPTAGDIHPCGDRLLIRTYGPLLEYRLQPDADFATIFEGDFTRVPVASEGQGEAVAYRANGLGYVTAGEGAQPAMHVVGCL